MQRETIGHAFRITEARPSEPELLMRTRIFVIVGFLVIVAGFISVLTQRSLCFGGGAETTTIVQNGTVQNFTTYAIPNCYDPDPTFLGFVLFVLGMVIITGGYVRRASVDSTAQIGTGDSDRK